MSTGFILAGVGLAAAGYAGRFILRNRKVLEKAAETAAKALPTESFSKYHHGGFQLKMDRREASMILGVPMMAKPNRIKEAHKKLMIINHPDRGGSPYLATKINEAKDLLETSK